MRPTAYSYIRFSTRAQMAGDSMSRQLLNARNYALRHNMRLDETSYQDLGISAFKSKNATDGALGAFVKALEEGLIPTDTTLIVESLDRISRATIMDALPLFMRIINLGVTLVTLSDGERAYSRKQINKDHGMSLFGSMMVLIRAHEESVVKSLRSKAGIQASLEKGIKHGKCPFWLQVAPNRTTFRVLKRQVDLVHVVFETRRSGIGAHRIARQLNETLGMKWTTPQVVHLLQNPSVIGVRVSQAGYPPREGYYPRVIPSELYYDVQKLMSSDIGTKRGRRSMDEKNLFSGLLKCAECGSGMRFFAESPRVSQQYVRCLKAVTNAGCNAPYVNYGAFEKEAIGWLLVDQDEELVPLRDKKKPTKRWVTEAEIQQLADEQSRLENVIAKALNPAPFLARHNANELKLKVLRSAVEEEPDFDERLFPERALELVEKHQDAALSGNKDELLAVRREIRTAFYRGIKLIRVFPEERADDEHVCTFAVTFRSFDGEHTRRYKRPALQNPKGVRNGWTRPNNTGSNAKLAL
ncbi:recombinase family protein [Variovorax sp. LG9.2]|uniref:recombinase family protein n=1 Tax=Variovorax sp. LG9.2 TaxID=3048626 RepID=UPI002B23EB23|nr:recombinase family protein [Variovorax sp. LG9.2]MEB0059790.1 recombinase family protein [Variovorax sp. LG9.2]